MNYFSLSFAFILIIGILCSAAAGAKIIPAGCIPGNNQSDTPPDDGTRIPVGILVMKSGFISDIGTEYSRVFDLVQRENNRSLIQPIVMDGGSEAAVASSSWKKMVSTTPDLPIVITVASWTTNVVYPDAADAGIVQLALGSAVVNRSHPADHLLRFTPGVEQESPILASYLGKFNRIALIGGDNDYTNGYFTALDSLLPGKILLKSYYDPDIIESTLNITGIGRSDPDVIVLLSVSEAGRVAELIRKEGINVPLVGTRVLARNSLAETEAAEGLIFTTPVLNESHPFFQKYFDEYGEDATFYGAEGFDAMTTLYSAVSECQGAPDCVASWYKNRTFEGALGLVRFDESGVASYPIGLKIVHDGRFERYP